ncbi:MAG: Rnase Y domain-containing protein, partial [Candidatus Staskawiczbacteria bacterium]
MDEIILSIIVAVVALIAGGFVGYYIRQNLAKKRAGSLEAKLQKRVVDVKEETANLVKNAEKKSAEILERTQKDVDERRKEFLKAQTLLLSRETLLNERIASFETKEKELQDKGEKLKAIKESLDELRKEAETKLEKVADL